MGSGAAFAIQYGRRDEERLKTSMVISFILIAIVTFILNIAVFWGLDGIIRLLQVTGSVAPLMHDYLWIIFWGMAATFLYNYFANLLRAVGNSVTPLLFLAVSAVLNIVLDLVFVLVFSWGIKGAAIATVIAQFAAGLGIMAYALLCFPELRISRRHLRWDGHIAKDIASLSFLTCLQQSVMVPTTIPAITRNLSCSLM